MGSVLAAATVRFGTCAESVRWCANIGCGTCARKETNASSFTSTKCPRCPFVTSSNVLVSVTTKTASISMWMLKHSKSEIVPGTIVGSANTVSSQDLVLWVYGVIVSLSLYRLFHHQVPVVETDTLGECCVRTISVGSAPMGLAASLTSEFYEHTPLCVCVCACVHVSVCLSILDIPYLYSAKFDIPVSNTSGTTIQVHVDSDA